MSDSKFAVLKSATQNVDLLALALAALAARSTWRRLRESFQTRPYEIFHIPNPPGIRGSLWGQPPAPESNQTSERHVKWEQEARKAVGPNAGSVFTVDMTGDFGKIFVTHPADLEHILVTAHGVKFGKGSDYDNLSKQLGPENLVTLRDEAAHSVQRRLVGPAFNPATLKEIANGVLAKQVDSAMSGLVEHQFSRKEQPAHPSAPSARPVLHNVLLDEAFDQIALHTVAEASFKKNPSTMGCDKNSVSKRFETIFGPDTVKLPFGFGRLAQLASLMVKLAAVHSLRQLGEDMLSKVRQEKKEEEANGRDPKNMVIIDHLAASSLSDSAVVDHITAFLFAGHDTTSKALLWCSYLLAMNPEKQALLLEELDSAVGLETVPTLETVKDLPYLNSVIKETLRLFPPVGIIRRVCLEDDVLPYSKRFIPKGKEIIWHQFVTHRLPTVYGEDADDFKPERWEKAKNAATIETHVPTSCDWIPFLAGKRNCIGKDFAWNELLIVMATLVRRYKIQLSPVVMGSGKKKKKYEEPQKPPHRVQRITIRPKKALEFDLTPRDA